MIATQSNSGCENKLARSVERALAKDWPIKEFASAVDGFATVTIQHAGQGPCVVHLDVSIDPSGGMSPNTKHFTVNFPVTLDVIRRLGDPELDAHLAPQIEAGIEALRKCIKTGENVPLGEIS